ncbi:MAG: hypothetical protein GDA65_05830 [Nitrospira sp. CR1.1]|nr:hypothetical protein [Nitrospira sp. CR1.1]
MASRILANFPQKSTQLEGKVAQNDGVLIRKHEKLGLVYTPRDNWTFLNDRQLSEILAPKSSISKTSVTVLNLGAIATTDLCNVHKALSTTSCFGNPEDCANPIRKLIDIAAVNTVSTIENLIGRCLKKILHVRLALNRPYLESSSYNLQAQSFMGLHYDKFKNYTVGGSDLFYLIGLNLGVCERYFCFSRLLPNKIAESQSGQDTNRLTIDESACGLGTALQFYSGDPIYRIAIAPLEAYIVPTQCIIHDGMTNRKGLIDKCLFIACQFHDN